MSVCKTGELREQLNNSYTSVCSYLGIGQWRHAGEFIHKQQVLQRSWLEVNCDIQSSIVLCDEVIARVLGSVVVVAQLSELIELAIAKWNKC